MRRPRQSRPERRLAPLVCVAVALLAAPDAAADEPERYFYFGYEYGTQSLFGPLYVFLNRGFDILQIRPGSRNVFDQPYASDAANVFHNLASPFAAIDDYGWGRFLREEVFPLSYTDDTARWGPNYTLHLLGGGMEFRALWEWYEDKKVPLPALFSAATLLSSALVNETLENKGIRGYNTDSVADLYLFDIGGMVLFAFDGVAKFFSRDVILSDWSLQPGFTAPKFDLYNAGNYFAMKWPLPFYKPLRLFGYTGLGAWAGLSYQFPSRYSITVAAGQRSYRLENASVRIVNNVVLFAPSAAIFVDRNESLLASLHVSNVEDHFVQFNLYPNAFFTTDPGIGLFAIVGKTGNVVVGLSLTRTFGVGVGYGAL